MNSIKHVSSKAYSASKAQLWSILTEPEWTEKYMFNCRIISSFEKGSSCNWKGDFNGTEVFLKGEILDINAPEMLKYSLVDPSLHDASDPNNYVHITYEIRPQNDKILLTVVNEIFDGNEDRMKEIVGGWEQMVLPAIERLLD